MTSATASIPGTQLPLPAFYKANKADQVFFVEYERLAKEAPNWAKSHGIKPAASDKTRITAVPIDFQLTFAHPQGGLPVGGAFQDASRFSEFIYRNIGVITTIAPTLDTHTVMQIFHAIMLVDKNGNHPSPGTQITDDDVRTGKWSINPAVAYSVANSNLLYLKAYLQHYVDTLKKNKNYALTVWPYHALLGGIEHALIPVVHEAIFFHSLVRRAERRSQIKGGNPLTENYSPLQPDVMNDHIGTAIAQKNTAFIKTLVDSDYVIIAGEAKSHCVAWFIDNLLTEIMAKDPALVSKIYLLEDCTSPVIIPGIIDFTQQANDAFDRFKKAGMHVVKSTDPIETWPDMKIE